MKIFRKRYYIAPEFQSEIIKKMLFIGLMGNALLYLVNFAIYFHFNTYAQKLPREQKKAFYEFFHQQIDLINYYFLGLGLLFTMGLIFYGIKLSHRMAGPLFNLKQQFKKIENCTGMEEIKSITPTRFRKNDFFHDLADHYNKALHQIQKLSQTPQKEHEDNILEFPQQTSEADEKKAA